MKITCAVYLPYGIQELLNNPHRLAYRKVLLPLKVVFQGAAFFRKQFHNCYAVASFLKRVSAILGNLNLLERLQDGGQAERGMVNGAGNGIFCKLHLLCAV